MSSQIVGIKCRKLMIEQRKSLGRQDFPAKISDVAPPKGHPAAHQRRAHCRYPARKRSLRLKSSRLHRWLP